MYNLKIQLKLYFKECHIYLFVLIFFLTFNYDCKILWKKILCTLKRKICFSHMYTCTSNNVKILLKSVTCKFFMYFLLVILTDFYVLIFFQPQSVSTLVNNVNVRYWVFKLIHHISINYVHIRRGMKVLSVKLSL